MRFFENYIYLRCSQDPLCWSPKFTFSRLIGFEEHFLGTWAKRTAWHNVAWHFPVKAFQCTAQDARGIKQRCRVHSGLGTWLGMRQHKLRVFGGQLRTWSYCIFASFVLSIHLRSFKFILRLFFVCHVGFKLFNKAFCPSQIGERWWRNQRRLRTPSTWKFEQLLNGYVRLYNTKVCRSGEASKGLSRSSTKC